MIRESREYPRIHTNYSAYYRVNNLDTYHSATLYNISGRGGLFITDESLKKGTKLEIKLKLPRIGELPLTGVVVRSEKIEEGLNSYKTAVEFKEKERRKYPRLKVNYLARYKIEDSKDNDYRTVSLRDVSAGGALFTAEEKLKKKSLLKIEIDFPERNWKQLSAVVVRNEEIPRSAVTLYNTGIEFVQEEDSQDSINYIKDFVEKRLSPASY